MTLKDTKIEITGGNCGLTKSSNRREEKRDK